MDPTPSAQDTTTREKLLAAAARLFAERGRDEVTIRDIAAAAGVRHGGINYHFRTKDDLYHEALMRYGPPAEARRVFLEASPPDDLPPAEARALLAKLIRRIVEFEVRPLDPIAAGLLRGELLREDGPNDRLFQAVIRPHLTTMADLIGRAFPNLSSELERRLAAFNVMSQCMFLKVGRSVALRLAEAEDFDDKLTDLAAERIIATTLEGLGTTVVQP